ncbi:MAG: hypothetical protein FWD47_01470 [Treponema sp.]|nr:hypothetical protein [Treponema sp.]
MVNLKKIFFYLLIFFLINISVFAADIKVGNIRLVLNERTGAYVLYYLDGRRYEQLFNRSQSTSYTSIYIDGNVSRLGSRPFRTRYENRNGIPSIIFESPNLRVTKSFTFIMTGNSQQINGVMVTYNVLNIGNTNTIVGLRMLLDTSLGEGRGRIPFISNSRNITDETLIRDASGERYWISRGPKVSLMGSIRNPLDNTEKAPDFIYFANWKRLNEAPWMLDYSEGRAFGNDSAVCYFYEPALLSPGSDFSYSFFLTAEDADWYNIPVQNVIETLSVNPVESERLDMNILIELQETLRRFISGQINLTEQELFEIERTIERYRQ